MQFMVIYPLDTARISCFEDTQEVFWTSYVLKIYDFM